MSNKKHRKPGNLIEENHLRAGGSETSKYLHDKAKRALAVAKSGRGCKVFRLVEVSKGCWKEVEVKTPKPKTL
jgi:hypothetical protein